MNKEDLAKYIGTKIKEFRTSRGMTQEELAELMGTTKQSIGRYENGSRRANQDNIFDLAEIFNQSIDDFFPNISENKLSITTIYNQLEPPRQKYVYSVAEKQLEEQNNVIDISDYLEEELYGYASAGTGQQVYDNPVETIRLHKSDIPAQHYDLILQVVGDSMEPAFKDSEYIFIRKTDNLRNGQFGVFIIDGESYLKKVYVEDDHLRLVSLNDKYEDLIFTEDDGITLVGQVVL